jgi:hypothetical protein
LFFCCILGPWVMAIHCRAVKNSPRGTSLINELFEKWRVVPFSPSPGHVIGGGSWWVFLGGPHVGTRHFRSATLWGGGGGWRLGLPSCWQGQRGASYCRLCRAKTVRDASPDLNINFVCAYILLTPKFCRGIYFVNANVLLTHIFC